MTLNRDSCLATNVLSLRDKIHSTAEALGEEGCSTFGVQRRGKSPRKMSPRFGEATVQSTFGGAKALILETPF